MNLLAPIQDAALLQGLSDEQRVVLAEAASEFSYFAGEKLFRLGDEASVVMVVRKGTIQLTMPLTVLATERQIVTEELGVGSTVAWSALVPPHSATVSARAMVDSELVGFSRARLVEMFAARPDIGLVVSSNLASVVGRRLRQTQAMWLRELQNSVSAKYG